MSLIDRVRGTIRRHELARADTRVVVAISGGSDSVALALIIRALADRGELRAAGLAHFNHQLRAAAVDDERFCRELASSFGWPILVESEDVATLARRDRRSLEDAARTARHAFFGRALVHFGADRVALGHTRDDQAETFLLRLVRGAGARGLAGMHPRRGSLIRPLIECRRGDLREFLEHQQVRSRHDESNDDVGIPRNRVRAELLPMLEQRFNPAVVDALADAADIAREEWLWLEDEAAALAARVCRRDGPTWRIDAAQLAAAPVALARIAMRRVMVDASAGRPVSFRHILRSLDLSRRFGSIDAPGQQLERIGSDIVIRRAAARQDSSDADAGGARPVQPGGGGPGFRYWLAIPGEVSMANVGWTVSAEEGVSAAAALESATRSGGTVAAIRRDRCGARLAVRSRRPGDRFRPMGLGGRKKLQDFFVDRKVGRRERDRVPLVVDESDRIVWVTGYAIDEEFRVTDPTQAVIVLKLKVSGGPV